MNNTMLAQDNTTDFLDFVKTSYEHKLVEFDPKNPIFWKRYKMKKEIDGWKDNITKTFWKQYSKDCSGAFEQILSLNIIDDYYNKLLDDYETLFDEIASGIFIHLYDKIGEKNND
jgi:hypothetical protein